MLERKLDIALPNTLEIIILLFIYAAEIMGEIGAYYVTFPYWDTVLHTLNGFLCAAIGFSLLDILNRHNSARFHLSPLYLAIVAFCFSMTVGVIWEFFECTMDQLFFLDMQKDTVVQSIGSIMLDPTGGQHPGVLHNITDVIVVQADGTQTALGLGGYLDIGLLDTMEDLFVNFIGALTFGFGLGVALFFSTGAPLPCKVCYPAAWLSLVLFALRDKACVPVAGALLLSAAGDAAGAVHDFLLQMFLFALAHVAYIRYFLPSAEFSRRRIAAAAVVGAGLLLFLFAGIVPRVASSVERTGVALYGAVIAAMLLSVLFYRGRYAPGFRVAALLFVFSDATIAWNKFVEPLPDATLRIMSTYYAAQYLFALLALAASSRKAAAARP